MAKEALVGKEGSLVHYYYLFARECTPLTGHFLGLCKQHSGPWNRKASRIANLVSLATSIGLLAFVSGRGSLPWVAWPRWRERLKTWWEAEE